MGVCSRNLPPFPRAVCVYEKAGTSFSRSAYSYVWILHCLVKINRKMQPLAFTENGNFRQRSGVIFNLI